MKIEILGQRVKSMDASNRAHVAYELQFGDGQNNPIENAAVQVFDGEELVYDTDTDIDGKASLELIFDIISETRKTLDFAVGGERRSKVFLLDLSDSKIHNKISGMQVGSDLRRLTCGRFFPETGVGIVREVVGHMSTGKYMLMDEQGVLLSLRAFNYIADFMSSGLAVAKLGNKFFLIDKYGNRVSRYVDREEDCPVRREKIDESTETLRRELRNRLENPCTGQGVAVYIAKPVSKVDVIKPIAPSRVRAGEVLEGPSGGSLRTRLLCSSDSDKAKLTERYDSSETLRRESGILEEPRQRLAAKMAELLDVIQSIALKTDEIGAAEQVIWWRVADNRPVGVGEVMKQISIGEEKLGLYVKAMVEIVTPIHLADGTKAPYHPNLWPFRQVLDKITKAHESSNVAALHAMYTRAEEMIGGLQVARDKLVERYRDKMHYLARFAPRKINEYPEALRRESEIFEKPNQRSAVEHAELRMETIAFGKEKLGLYAEAMKEIVQPIVLADGTKVAYHPNLLTSNKVLNEIKNAHKSLRMNWLTPSLKAVTDKDVASLNAMYARAEGIIGSLQVERDNLIRPNCVAETDMNVGMAKGRLARIKTLLAGRSGKFTVETDRVHEVDLAKIELGLNDLTAESHGKDYTNQKRPKRMVTLSKHYESTLKFAEWYLTHDESKVRF